MAQEKLVGREALVSGSKGRHFVLAQTALTKYHSRLAVNNSNSLLSAGDQKSEISLVFIW